MELSAALKMRFSEFRFEVLKGWSWYGREVIVFFVRTLHGESLEKFGALRCEWCHVLLINRSWFDKEKNETKLIEASLPRSFIDMEYATVRSSTSDIASNEITAKVWCHTCSCCFVPQPHSSKRIIPAHNYTAPLSNSSPIPSYPWSQQPVVE